MEISTTQSKPNRRMGPKGSDIWHQMLDAAEQILSDDGYGALTSRNVAAQTGVKQRLVYYYFRSMEELTVETFRRLSDREIERFEHVLASEHSLRETWQLCVYTSDTKLVSEFMALANRIEALRRDVREFIQASRRLQVEALERAIARSGAALPMPPRAAALLATATALALHREVEIGVSDGHDEVLKVITGLIDLIDPDV